MDTTTFFARFWGLLFLVMSLLFLIRPQSLERWVQHLQEESFLFVIGYISILLGLLTIAGHNQWALDWTVLITLIGWAALFKGTGRLMFPDPAALVEEQYENSSVLIKVGFSALLLLGFFLAY